MQSTNYTIVEMLKCFPSLHLNLGHMKGIMYSYKNNEIHCQLVIKKSLIVVCKANFIIKNKSPPAKYYTTCVSHMISAKYFP